MSTLKDRLREAQGQATSAPSLNVSAYIDMGQVEGAAVFKMYDRETKSNMYSKKPITGIFIGHSMMMEAFDKDAGANGGTWRTSYYFVNSDNVAVFEPNKDKFSFKGTVTEAEAFLSAKRLIPKKKYCLYLLTEKGLICVRTNVTLGINDIITVQKDLDSRMVVLVPTIYDANNKEIPKKTHGYLGKIAATNPPNYAHMILGEEINEEKAVNWGILQVIEDFKAWRTYKQKTGKMTDGEAPVKDEHIESPDLPQGDEPSPAMQRKAEAVAPQSKFDVDDDLPF